MMKEKVPGDDAHTPALLLAGDVGLSVYHALVAIKELQRRTFGSPADVWQARGAEHGFAGT